MDESNPLEAYHWLVLILIYGLPIAGLVFFGFIGAYVEKKHYVSIRAREAATNRLPIMASRTLEDGRAVVEARLVAAEVMISHDYFKRFLAQLRNFFGGRIRSYDTLLDRARREALLRLKEQCPDASIIANLRLETICVSTARKNSLVGVEIIAYGTAIRYA